MDAIVENRRDALKAKAPERRLWWRRVLMLGGVIIVVVGGLAFWLTGGRYVSTDDAYVEADKLMVSSDVSGIVSEVDVKEGQTVHKGDVLFRLDPKPFQIALDQAQSKMAESALTIKSMEQDYQRMLSDIEAQRAQVQLAQTSYDRQQALIKDRRHGAAECRSGAGDAAHDAVPDGIAAAAGRGAIGEARRPHRRAARKPSRISAGQGRARRGAASARPYRGARRRSTAR